MASIPPTASCRPLPIRRRCPRTPKGKEENKSTNIDSIPDELLFDILVRLPADFILDRAEFVCRKWHKVIHSDGFIDAQISHSSYGLLLSPRPRSHPVYLTATQGRVEASEMSYECKTTIYGSSCNGMALEFHRDEDSGKSFPHLVNPATKELVFLPEVSRSNRTICTHGCGIAYSASSMKYKVLLSFYGGARDRIHVDVCTVGVDKTWREIEISNLPKDYYTLLNKYPLTTEGFMHWDGSSHVLTLNVETETFTTSSMPIPQQGGYRWYYRSTGRYLNLFVDLGNLMWEVWEMKPESGEWRGMVPHKIELGAQKFALKYQTKLSSLEPLGWVKYPEILAFRFSSASVEHDCVIYNLVKNEINTVELPKTCVGYYRTFPHRNNLVSLS